MPIYEYTCRKCKAHVEIMQKISDEPPKRHAKCGGKLEKEWSQTSFQLKGSGWYVTDYAGRKQDTKETDAKETKEVKETKSEPSTSESKSSSGDDKPKSKKAEKTSSSASTTGKSD
ncbi:MAG TPA: zinc ribbon domain-containing protein [Pyrinomonadaceae bacterium]|jgi:putative FmdB family regulatory protein|nr:zinc ribbon domain-containing protein [Pyrinomonadaceae bacterium]